MRTEDELRHALSQAAQQAAVPDGNARTAVGQRVRRQRAVRYGAAAGIALALVAFALVSLTRPDHRASVRVVGPGPSPSAVPGPQPDTSSSPTTSQSGTVPAGFSAVSVTFVSANDGFVLGSAPCATPPCTVILRTSDTGKSWHRIPAPPAVVSQSNPPLVEPAPETARRIRFATTADGWVFGPDLWSTHDGGDHWTKQQPGGEVEDLEASAGVAHMVVLATSSSGASYRISSTPIARDGWTPSPTTIQKGAAPVAGAQIVLQGQSGWVLVSERTVQGGARLTNSGWVSWTPPCLDVYGPATLAAATRTDLVVACDEGVWGGSTPPSRRLYTSSDGGDVFSRSQTIPPGWTPLASPRPGTIVLESNPAQGNAELQASFDSGRTWSSVYRGKTVNAFAEVGFTAIEQGIAIEPDDDSQAGHLIITSDGGHTWHRLAFGPTASSQRRCESSDLRLAVGEPAQRGISQQQTLTVAMTNVSSTACFMEGYPGVALLTPDGKNISFTYERSSDAVVTAARPSRVALAPRDSAWVTLNKSVCQAPSPTAAIEVRLIPPDERDPVSGQLRSNAAAFAACDRSEPGSVVHVSPVSATPRDTLRAN